MSTYNDVTTSVSKLSVSSTAGTHYTCPASTRAKINFQYISIGASAQFQIAGVTIFQPGSTATYPGSGGTGSSTDLSNYFSRDIWLNAGDTIVSTGSGITCEAVIQEFSNP